MQTVEIAKKYIKHGFSPIPLIDGEKRPSIKNWQQYSNEPMGFKEVTEVFKNTNSIGLVMGFDGIQCLDIDAKHFTGLEYTDFCLRLEEECPGLKEKMIVQHTRSNGYHWIFKCDEIAGNQKLARNVKGEVTFETRGRGGQIVTYPSQGYKIEGKITNVQRITPEERDILFRVAKTMDEMAVEVAKESKRIGDIETDNNTPWGEFRESHSALDILMQHGWTPVGENTKYIYLLRPGNTDNKTSGVIFKDSQLFWPWTTSTEFEAETPYDGFQCYTILNHGGDFPAAIKDIREKGYGKKYELHPVEFNIEDQTEEQVDDMLEKLKRMRVDSTIPVVAPPVCIEILMSHKTYVFGSYGNFSLVQGKAKSRKSYFISCLAAAAISPQIVSNTFRGQLNGRKCIYIDTEQGDYHAAKVKRRIQSMAGLDPEQNYDRLEFFKFRALDTNRERMQFVELIFQTIEDIGFMVIDGIADLASKGVNDEEEATLIASKLLKWTADYNCHITIVLHENKNDRNAKGHLGAYLVQKAETTLSAKKSDRSKEITEINPEYTRNLEPPAMEMTVNATDHVEFNEIEEDEFYNRTRVWTIEDKKRISKKIEGKSKGDATVFIRDTEDCKKKDAEKVLSEMEDEHIIYWNGKRPKYVALEPPEETII